MAKKNALRKNALNENYKRLARDIISSALEALGGTSDSRDKYAKACGFKDGEQDALEFFATDWAEKLMDLTLGFEEPDTLIGKLLKKAYGPVAVCEIPNARRAPKGPHIRRRIGNNNLGPGGRNGLRIRLDCI